MSRTRSVRFGLLAALAAVATMSGLPARAQSTISEQEAHAIGVDAYLYFYPLVSMDVTRRQSTNVEPGKVIGKGPIDCGDWRFEVVDIDGQRIDMVLARRSPIAEQGSQKPTGAGQA